jgi:hypothetical protein
LTLSTYIGGGGGGGGSSIIKTKRYICEKIDYTHVYQLPYFTNFFSWLM